MRQTNVLPQKSGGLERIFYDLSTSGETACRPLIERVRLFLTIDRRKFDYDILDAVLVRQSRKIASRFRLAEIQTKFVCLFVFASFLAKLLKKPKIGLLSEQPPRRRPLGKEYH